MHLQRLRDEGPLNRAGDQASPVRRRQGRGPEAEALAVCGSAGALAVNVADALGRFVDPISRWRARRRFAMIERFLASGAQSVYQYPRFRRGTDLVVRGVVGVADLIRFSANCVLI